MLGKLSPSDKKHQIRFNLEDLKTIRLITDHKHRILSVRVNNWDPEDHGKFRRTKSPSGDACWRDILSAKLL